MGFFQDLKQDLSQTVSEMESGGKSDEVKLDEEVKDEMDFDVAAMLDNIDMDNIELEGDNGEIPEAFNGFDGIENPEDGENLEAVIGEAGDDTASDTAVESTEDFVGDIGNADEPSTAIGETDMEAQVEVVDENQQSEWKDLFSNEEETSNQLDPNNAAGFEADVEIESNNEQIQDINAEGENEMEELLKEVELNVVEPELIEEPVAVLESDETQRAISSDTAVITEGMTITGDITSSGNMDLIGTVTGNIDILGKLNITGTVTGNSSAAEIYAESAQINGEVKSKGSVKIGQSSVIIGDIFATSAVIAGAVKGDIDVHGPVILDTSAIVMGNIKSKSVQINNGAVIEGMCSQCYADVSPSTFFNDVKKNRNKGN